jgi:hypothetical protein
MEASALFSEYLLLYIILRLHYSIIFQIIEFNHYKKILKGNKNNFSPLWECPRTMRKAVILF